MQQFRFFFSFCKIYLMYNCTAELLCALDIVVFGPFFFFSSYIGLACTLNIHMLRLYTRLILLNFQSGVLSYVALRCWKTS
uniref:Uncharacterized protein n=1 Tax=Ixodes ricinus TaxID=34613 RepID=A0A6B0U821_IXORI